MRKKGADVPMSPLSAFCQSWKGRPLLCSKMSILDILPVAGLPLVPERLQAPHSEEPVLPQCNSILKIGSGTCRADNEPLAGRLAESMCLGKQPIFGSQLGPATLAQRSPNFAPESEGQSMAADRSLCRHVESRATAQQWPNEPPVSGGTR